MNRIQTCVLGDPLDPKARMVPLYHGGNQLQVAKLWFGCRITWNGQGQCSGNAEMFFFIIG
ncbi:hypothetical protein E2C01_101741 [Portunus trituberculatus]|uniref:Uncharacterized protein n=1 Tax=Portunus trituberculatus TaxID=210409 RepID=A0A5B7KGH0_PORTR|nr:hypothetical protein [Portunus trituberculatus]